VLATFFLLALLVDPGDGDRTFLENNELLPHYLMLYPRRNVPLYLENGFSPGQ
jgi:hypothetical protein